MFGLADLLIAIYATGFVVMLACAGTNKLNFPSTFSRFEVIFSALTWPVFLIGIIPLAFIAMKEDS